MPDLKDVTIVKAAATATSGTGISTLIGLIPDILGVCATVVGITVTLILWSKQNKKINLEIEILQRQKEKLENER